MLETIGALFKLIKKVFVTLKIILNKYLLTCFQLFNHFISYQRFIKLKIKFFLIYSIYVAKYNVNRIDMTQRVKNAKSKEENNFFKPC